MVARAWSSYLYYHNLARKDSTSGSDPWAKDTNWYTCASRYLHKNKYSQIDAHVRLVSVSCVYFTTLTWPPWKFAAILCTSIKMSLWKSLSHLVGRCLSFDSYTGFSTACDGWVVLAFSVVVQFLQCLRWWWFLFCPNFLLVPQLLTS